MPFRQPTMPVKFRMCRPVQLDGVADTGTSGYDGDGKEATKALIFNPTGLVVDGSGNVFFSDTRNQVVRKVTSNGTI